MKGRVKRNHYETLGPGLKLDKEMIDVLLDSMKSGSPW